MTKLKVGDKVKRTAQSMWLDYGTIYTVASVSDRGNTITVEGFPQPFVAERFVKVEEDTSKYHPHHDVIVAWAKGAKLQRKDTAASPWADIQTPMFFSHYQYRVKPDNEDKIREIKKTIKELEAQIKELE